MITVYYQKCDSNLSEAGYYLLESILKVKKEDLLVSKNGKPYIKDNKVYFNISHSHEMVVLAVSDFPVGIDVEYIPNMQYNLDNKTYTAWLNEEPREDKLLYLTKKWVLKESYIKLKDIKLSIDSIKNAEELDQNLRVINNEYVLNVINENNDKMEELVCIARTVEKN